MRFEAGVLLAALLAAGCAGPERTRVEAFDVVVYGATPGGIAAALQAMRMDRSVVLIEPSDRIGGRLASGDDVGCVGEKESYGGISRKFYRDIRAYYAELAGGKPMDCVGGKCIKARCCKCMKGKCCFPEDSDAMWCFNPAAVHAVLERWERGEGLRVERCARLDRSADGVTIIGGRIASIRTEDGRVWEGGVFVDGTYNGELLAAAGASCAGEADSQTKPVALRGSLRGSGGGIRGISYDAIVPKRGDCANLLVPVCNNAVKSACDSACGAPIHFAMGQVAGTAASLALATGCAVQDVDYATLKKRLVDDGQRLDIDVFAFAKPQNEIAPPPALLPAGASRETWERTRRAEVVRELLEKEYGVRPVERPADLKFVEAAPAEDCLGGKAITKRVRATYSGPGGAAEMYFRVWIPKSSRKVPAFVHSSPRPAETAADPNGPRPTYLLPIEKIISRGYAVIAYCNQEVAKDWSNGPAVPTNGVFKAFGPWNLDSRGPHEWGILSAWAWGMSRILDWIETEPLLDAKRVAAIGLSRNGKTALVAGAFDQRFAMTVSCCSGCGGAKLNHMCLPYSESIRQIGIAHRWFSPEYMKWKDRDLETPFDQHWLMALVAPRLLYVSSAREDDWAGPCAEFASARLASTVWELYGEKGLVAPMGFPLVDSPLQEGRIGYHFRSGRHAILSYDWDRYLDFADRNGWNK